MMKKATLSAIAFLGVGLASFAQSNPFLKNSWRIENDGPHLALVKVAKVDPLKNKVSFHYINFKDGGKFESGTSCFETDGFYSLSEEGQIEFSEGAAAMVSGCEEPQSISGTYAYQQKGGKIILEQIYSAEDAEETTDAAYDSDDIEAAAQAAADVAADAARDIAGEEPQAVDEPVVKYAGLRSWFAGRFDPSFFNNLGVDQSLRISVKLYFDQSGKVEIKNIEGTKDPRLKTAIQNEIENNMPFWNRNEVDYDTNINVPLRFNLEDN